MPRESGNRDTKTVQIILQRSDSTLVAITGQEGAPVFH